MAEVPRSAVGSRSRVGPPGQHLRHTGGLAGDHLGDARLDRQRKTQGLRSASMQQHIKVSKLQRRSSACGEMNQTGRVTFAVAGPADVAAGNFWGGSMSQSKQVAIICLQGTRQASCLPGQRQPSSACSSTGNAGEMTIQGDGGQVQGQR